MNLVKILFLSANPSDTARLKTDEERRKIEAEILKSPHRERLQLIYEPAVRPDSLIEVLRRHRPQIIHFSGHGSEANEIILESDDGRSRLVGTHILEELFRLQGRSVRVIMLNACYSEAQARVLTRYVDCAIGMNRAIPDPMAIDFATAFYQGLAYGEPVRAAFDASLLQLRLSDLPGLRGPSRDLVVDISTEAEVEGQRLIPELMERPGSDASQLVIVEEILTAGHEGQVASDTSGERAVSGNLQPARVGLFRTLGPAPLLIGGSVFLVVIGLFSFFRGLGLSPDRAGTQDAVTKSGAGQPGALQSQTVQVPPPELPSPLSDVRPDDGLRRMNGLPAADVLRTVYESTPPNTTARLGLDVNILSRRGRQNPPVPLRDGDELASAVDDYQLVITPHASGFLYLFQIDAGGQVNWLFPKNPATTASTGENPVRAGDAVSIPAGGEWLFLDNLCGVEHVYAVLSASQWESLERALSRGVSLAEPVQPANPVEGRVRSGSVQAPNRLGRRSRGVGGKRPEAAGRPEGDSAVVVERWIRHVEPGR